MYNYTKYTHLYVVIASYDYFLLHYELYTHALNWLLTKWSAKFRIGVYTWELHVYWVLSFIVCMCSMVNCPNLLSFCMLLYKMSSPFPEQVLPWNQNNLLAEPLVAEPQPCVQTEWPQGQSVTIATTRTCMHVKLIASLGFKQCMLAFVVLRVYDCSWSYWYNFFGSTLCDCNECVDYLVYTNLLPLYTFG